MAVERMMRASIVAHKSIKSKLLNTLQQQGVLQVTNVRERFITADDPEAVIRAEEQTGRLPADEIRALEAEISKISAAIAYLRKYEKQPGMFDLAYLVVPKKEYAETTESFNYSFVAQECLSIIDRINVIESRQNALDTMLAELEPWESLDIDFSKPIEWENARMQFGAVSTGRIDAVEKILAENPQAGFDLQQVGKRADMLYYILFVYEGDADFIYNEVKKNGWNEIRITGVSGMVVDEIKKLTAEKAALIKELAEIEEKSRKLSSYLPQLKMMFDFKHNELSRYTVQENFYHTEECVMIDGWVAEKDAVVIKEFANATDVIDIELREPVEGEEPPTKMDVPKVARPFTLVTELFGLPRYNEIDPTIALTPFFMLFFAMCIADVGYAIFAPLIAWLVLRMMTGGKSGQRIFNIILFSMPLGLFVGFLLGGFFGVSLREVEWLKPVYAAIDPHNIFDINGSGYFVIVLGVGSFALLVGRVISFIMKLKMKETASAFLDDLPWVFITASFPVWLFVVFMNLVPKEIIPSWFYINFNDHMRMMLTDPLLIIGLLMVMLFSGRARPKIAGKVADGLYNAYGITGVLGDILSYSRLLALGLSGGAIATVINQLSQMGKDATSIGAKIGFGLVTVLILIAGHTVNIVLSAMGAMVHTIRLQFVEFFSKFYQGGGIKFQPFENKYEYLLVQDEQGKSK